MTDVLVGQPIPWHLVRPPSLPPTVVARPRVSALLDGAVSGGPVTLVCAPAGFGKSMAVADWIRARPETVVWFSGGSQGLTPGRLLAGVTAAAAQAGLPGFADLLGAIIEPGSSDEASTTAVSSAVDAMLERWRRIDGPVTIVVDDVHGLELGAHSSVTRLLTDLPEQLRVVLVGRDNIAAHLARHVVYGEVCVLDGDDLAMTSAEVAELSARVGSTAEPADLLERTGGWPLAVSAAVQGGEAGAGRHAHLLPDVVREEVIERVSPALAELMLTTSVARRLDADLAAELCGYPAQDLLEECVEQGLFLRRVESPGRPATYVWHEAFADACQQLAMRQDLARVRRAHLTVARHLAAAQPLDAIGHALDSGEPGYAEALLGRHWPEIVTGGEVDRLHRTVTTMLTAGTAAGFVRHVGVVALTLAGDRRAAQQMRGGSAADRTCRDQLAEAFSAAVSGVDTRARHAACDAVRAAIGGDHGLSPASHASALFLLGWVETRLRRQPALPIETMRSAQRAARSLGLPGLDRRAGVELGAALTIAGLQREAVAAVASASGSVRPAPASSGSDVLDDGGVPDFVRGHAAYWRGDYAESVAVFRGLVAGERGDTIAGAIGRVFGVHAACADGTRAWIDEAERALHDVEGHDVLGLPMAGFVAAARAAIAERRDNVRATTAHARVVADTPHLPVMHVLTAEIHRRAGHLDLACEVADLVPFTDSPLHVKAIVLVTQAVRARAQRKFGVAHRLLESALDLAMPHECVRPFDPRREPALRDLLDEHARWGGHHEAVLVRLLNDAASDDPYRLSDREREVLAYLRTSLTVAEIAERLFISVNTVKTHQRSLYRKLGVTTRREAIQVRV